MLTMLQFQQQSISEMQEQAKWGERLGYSKEITADKGNRKNREKSRIQRQTRSEK